MNTFKFTGDQLTQSALSGEQQAAEALSVLAKNKVSVRTTNVKDLVIANTDVVFQNLKGHEIIAYTQTVSGIFGVSLLSMERRDALVLVDLFNRRASGSTVVMQELDRSTIRETLNILANAYATQLAKFVDDPILLDVPRMITSSQLSGVAKLIESKEKKAVVFETQLQVENVDFKVNLYFFFLTGGE